jgi:hypothetical protein
MATVTIDQANRFGDGPPHRLAQPLEPNLIAYPLRS